MNSTYLDVVESNTDSFHRNRSLETSKALNSHAAILMFSDGSVKFWVPSKLFSYPVYAIDWESTFSWFDSFEVHV